MMRRLTEMPRDSGAGMVIVLAAIFLTAMMTTTILASTIFSVRHTTATRANVEAVAAAEAGAQLVAQGLRTGPPGFVCAGSYSSPSDHAYTGPYYDAEVFYVPKGDPEGAWVQGCPPDDVEELKVTANGYAQAKGVSNSSRDTAATEVLFKRPNPDLRFNKALFGDLNMNLNTALTVTPGDGDLFTNGNYTCSSNSRIEGNLYIGGSGTFSSAPCQIDGDVIVEGTFTCGGGLYIGGDLTVLGDTWLQSATCDIRGSVHIGGNVSIPNAGTPIGGDLVVYGDLNTSGIPSVGGALNVRQRINNNSGWWFDQLVLAYPNATWNDSSVQRPDGIPESPDNEMPKLRADDPMWEGWAAGNWDSAIKEIRSTTVPPCNLGAGGPQFNSPLAINSRTIYDLRSSCGNLVLGGDLTIVLNDDAAILANNISMNGNVRVESGDGEEHTLYVVVPWPTGQVNCSSSGGSITFTSGAWSQDNKTKGLFYAPNNIVIRSNPVLRGQLYACSIDANTAFTVEYAPAGDVEIDPTLTGLRLQYLRDVTG